MKVAGVEAIRSRATGVGHLSSKRGGTMYIGIGTVLLIIVLIILLT